MPPDTAVATAEPQQLPSVRKPPAEALNQLEQVVLQGNLATLSENERIGYYARVCESLGLNPLTRPFEYITLNGKLTLYARKDATDQLRQIHGVDITALERERADELQVVTAHVRDRYGRSDSAIGAVSVKGLSGEALANALMKAETKAKRRATLSIVGLGWMDEIEAQDARAVEVAPRQAVASAIRSRTAALTAATDQPEQGQGAPPASPAPACSHPSQRHQATEQGVVCGECGTLIAARETEEAPAEQATPRARGKAKAKKTAEPKKAGDDGYWRARAHAMADERGLDPEALKRIAGDVLDKEGDWSRTELDEDAWEYVAGVVSSAPERGDQDDEAWMASATVFAGNQAIAAGVAKKLTSDEDWQPVEESVAEMFRASVDDLGAEAWIEYGLRIGARS